MPRSPEPGAISDARVRRNLRARERRQKLNLELARRARRDPLGYDGPWPDEVPPR